MAGPAVLAVWAGARAGTDRRRRTGAGADAGAGTCEGWLQALDGGGRPVGEPSRHLDLVAAMREIEIGRRPRWVLADALAGYPLVLSAGLRIRPVTT